MTRKDCHLCHKALSLSRRQLLMHVSSAASAVISAPAFAPVYILGAGTPGDCVTIGMDQRACCSNLQGFLNRVYPPLPSTKDAFLNIVKAHNRTSADAEITHHPTSPYQLEPGAVRLGRKPRWDSNAEHLLDAPVADRPLHQPMRSWSHYSYSPLILEELG